MGVNDDSTPVDPSRVASVEAGPAVPSHLLPHTALAAVAVLALSAAACGELAEHRLGDSVKCPAPPTPTLAAQEFRVLFNPNFGASGRREIHVAGPPGTQVTIGSDLPSSIPASGFRRFDNLR